MEQKLASGKSWGEIETSPPPGIDGAGPDGRGIDDFDSLVQLHRPRIFRFMLASLRDTEAAENLTQDCFIRAYKARVQFRGDSSSITWLMQIAANLVRDHQGNSRLKFWRRSLRSDVNLNDVSDWVPDQQRSPEAIASAKEQVRAVWNAAASLSERQRTVFLLRFVEDMDLLEIAAVTGMKEGTVKAHLFRALHAVRAGLEEKK
jgi:RNA polymerase sigma-70 factor (ECF subfamily)